MKNTLKLIPAALLVLSLSAQAAVTITIQEVGDDLVVAGSGSINSLNGVQFDTNDPSYDMGMLNPREGALGNFSSPGTTYVFESNATPFGTEPIFFTNDRSGGSFGISLQNGGGMLFLPDGYEVGDPISFEMTFAGKAINGVNIQPGTYLWSWVGDYVKLCIRDIEPCAAIMPPTTPASVPTFGAFGLIGLAGVIGAAGVAMTRRRKQ